MTELVDNFGEVLDLDEQDDLGDTPLHTAAKERQYETLKKLVTFYEDKNKQEKKTNKKKASKEKTSKKIASKKKTNKKIASKKMTNKYLRTCLISKTERVTLFSTL